MNNLPKIKVGIVAVSRDCFPESLSAVKHLLLRTKISTARGKFMSARSAL